MNYDGKVELEVHIGGPLLRSWGKRRLIAAARDLVLAQGCQRMIDNTIHIRIDCPCPDDVPVNVEHITFRVNHENLRERIAEACKRHYHEHGCMPTKLYLTFDDELELLEGDVIEDVATRDQMVTAGPRAVVNGSWNGTILGLKVYWDAAESKVE